MMTIKIILNKAFIKNDIEKNILKWYSNFSLWLNLIACCYKHQHSSGYYLSKHLKYRINI